MADITASVSDLHPALVRAFLARVRPPGADDLETLQRCGVLTRGTPAVPTRFGLLALGIRPERFLPERAEPVGPDRGRGAAALLPILDGGQEVTSRELVERSGLALGTVRRHLITLLERGLVEATAPSTSKRRTYRRVTNAA